MRTLGDASGWDRRCLQGTILRGATLRGLGSATETVHRRAPKSVPQFMATLSSTWQRNLLSCEHPRWRAPWRNCVHSRGDVLQLPSWRLRCHFRRFRMLAARREGRGCKRGAADERGSSQTVLNTVLRAKLRQSFERDSGKRWAARPDAAQER